MVNGISSGLQNINQFSLQKMTNDGDSDDVKSVSSNQVSNKGNCNPCTNCGACGKIQDPKTVTSQQLKSPIDIRV